jgi:uracil-DNA glycosylase family 4
MNRQEKLADIQEIHARQCQCSLRHTATRPVYGIGSPDARIVFIGEAPGKKEDLEGKPFIGSAGKILTELLGSIKLSREDVYITNIIKYRPPNNRDPLPQEKADCSAWLSAELAYIQPTLVVFLGRHSLNHFFPEMKIGDVHGQMFTADIPDIPTRHFLPLYHPASAIYNRSLRSVLTEDFKKIPVLLKKIGSART